MRFRICTDLPGYLRVRTPRYEFGWEESYGIYRKLEELKEVYEIKVNAVTGSVFVRYTEGKDKILKKLLSIDIEDLEEVPIVERNQEVQLKSQFTETMMKIPSRIILRRFILPIPLRNLLILKDAFQYLKTGFEKAIHNEIDVDVLDASAVGLSLAYGHFSSAASIMVMLRLADTLESFTRKNMENRLMSSLLFRMEKAWVLEGEEEVERPLNQIVVGDKVIVRMGSMIPVDGKVVSGEASVNQSSMTGESEGKLKTQGDTVFAGTVVEDGKIIVETLSCHQDSRIQQIMEKVRESESLKSEAANHAESLANRIVPLNFGLALFVLITTGSSHKALSALTVDYSCAIKMATPISIIAAMKEGSDKEILIKSGNHLEQAAKTDLIVFDKTGTLTKSRPEVQKVTVLDDRYDQNKILRLSACLEEHFPHSIANALVRKAEQEHLEHREIHGEVEYIVAHGIVSTIGENRVMIGSRHFLEEDEGVAFTDEKVSRIDAEGKGLSNIFLAVNKDLIGMVSLADEAREESGAVIEELRELGVEKIVMITGDSENIAASMAEELKLDDYKSQVMPEDKASIVKRYQEEGYCVMMVGDGVNDSLAMSQADVSVSLKDGSDLAREVSDINLLSGSLESLVTLRKLALGFEERVQSNYRKIIGVNTSLLALGTTGVMMPETTAFLHNLYTVGVSGASTRPYLKRR